MFGILWLFLQSAASHLLYLALRLETGSFPKPLSAREERACLRRMQEGDDSPVQEADAVDPPAGGPLSRLRRRVSRKRK